MTTEPRAPTGDFRWRAADLVMRKSMEALERMQAVERQILLDRTGLATGHTPEPPDPGLMQETERALEMASRALEEHQIEEN